MDQAAFEDQRLLRYFGGCGQVAVLDRRLGLCPGRHRQEAAEDFRQPLPNPRDLEPDHVWMNPIGSITCASSADDIDRISDKQLIPFD